jgi:hypothetical protein
MAAADRARTIDAQIMPRMRRRTPKNAASACRAMPVCGMPRRARRCRHNRGARKREKHARAAAVMRRPRLRYCCVVRTELVAFLCELARRLPAPIVVRTSRGCGRHSAPVVVRDALIGAADEQLRAGASAAVTRRKVQRRPPAGRGGHGCIGVTVGHRRPRAERAAAKAHPLFCLVFTSARAPSSAAMIL